MNHDPQKDEKENRKIVARIRHFFWRGCQFIFGLVFAYAAAVAIGLIPVNRDFESPDEGGVAIYVFSGGVHSDLILPVKSKEIDWQAEFSGTQFKKPVDRYSHVAIGWGDRGFYLETPTWSDLKASTAARALFTSSESVVHVHFMNKPKESETCRRLVISKPQYQQLVEFIRGSFSKPSGSIDWIKGEAYGASDAFFNGAGSYHALNTCNCWAANALKETGVTVPWFAPLPRTVLWYLPKDKVENETKTTETGLQKT